MASRSQFARACARFKPKLLRAAQHLRDADLRCAAAVTNLPCLGTNAVTAQQHHQRAKPGIIGFGIVSPRRLGWNLNAILISVSYALRPAKHSGKAVGGGLEVAAREIRQRRSARHRYKLAIPDRFEFGTRDQFGVLGCRPHHENSVLIRAANEKEAAVPQDRDRRQLGGGKPFPVGPVYAPFEAKLFGTTQHLRGADRLGPAFLANSDQTRL